jgi:hypothetical protein
MVDDLNVTWVVTDSSLLVYMLLSDRARLLLHPRIHEGIYLAQFSLAATNDQTNQTLKHSALSDVPTREHLVTVPIFAGTPVCSKAPYPCPRTSIVPTVMRHS